jgi:site-specific recombinase XerD
MSGGAVRRLLRTSSAGERDAVLALVSRRDSSTGQAQLGLGSRGRAWSSAAVRLELHRLASEASVRRRFAPRQLRHAHALELAREDVALNIIQRQLGHANLGTTSIYLQGIDTEQISPPSMVAAGP